MEKEDKLNCKLANWVTAFLVVAFGILVYQVFAWHQEPSPPDPLSKRIIAALSGLAFLLHGLTFRIVFTSSGHQPMWAVWWRGEAKFVFLKTRFRPWNSVIVNLDIGRPICALNILETPMHFPLLWRIFCNNYDDACVYILKHGKAAKIAPKTLKHLRMIAGKKGLAVA